MLDLEIMEWRAQFAEGYTFYSDSIASKLGGGWLEYYEQKCTAFGLSMPNSIMYSDFLQKTIEGINTQYDKYNIEIIQNCTEIIIWGNYDVTIKIVDDNYDGAKEATIKHVFNCMRKEGK